MHTKLKTQNKPSLAKENSMFPETKTCVCVNRNEQKHICICACVSVPAFEQERDEVIPIGCINCNTCRGFHGVYRGIKFTC